MSDVVVRDARVEDWEAWRALRLRALRDTPSAFGSTYEREAAFRDDHWKTRLADPDGAKVLAFVGDTAVGMGGGFQDLPGWLHVVAMWTDPAFRGHGVGAAVLRQVCAWAADRGLKVHLDVTVGNDAARRLYERSGFEATGEIEPLREGSPYLIERMVLRVVSA